MIGLAIPYFQIDPESGVYENSQLATFMGVGFLVLLFAIVDLLAYGVSNRQKVLKDPNSHFYFRKGERYWKIPLAEPLYGAFAALHADPEVDIFAFLDGEEVELHGPAGADLAALHAPLNRLGEGYAGDFRKLLEENRPLFGKNPRDVMALAMGEKSLKKAAFLASIPRWPLHPSPSC